MPSFEEMKKLYSNASTIGQQLKESSDMVMQETWDNDVSTRRCYIYDYYHDDNKELCTDYDPSLSTSKIPVDLKFIIKEYKSAAKDDPEYHIQFSPDDWNSQRILPDYFKDYAKWGIHFPIGLYCDIPDDRGAYWKYLIFYEEIANQFPKVGVMRCNYLFRWITDNGIHRYERSMYGVQRTQNSYNSGVKLMLRVYSDVYV